MQISSKFPHASTTIFSTMTELAAELNALNLSQGFPDFAPPQPLLDFLAQAPQATHQYASAYGIPLLRQQIAQQYQNLHQIIFNPDTEVTITAGATIGIYCIIQAFIQPLDEVIIFDPSYDSYVPAVTLAGGKSVHIALQAPDFRVDWNQFKSVINNRTRMVIVNTPHNPTGQMWTKQDWLTLIEIIQDRNIIVLSDEVYEFLNFDQRQHYSVMDFEALRERSFAVGSFGKSYHVTGWRTGYCVAAAPLMKEFRQVYQFANFCSVHPCQSALSQYIAHSPHHLTELSSFYQTKRDYFLDGLSESKFSFEPAQGTYFQLLDYSPIRDDLNDIDMCQWLARQHKIVAIPISVFYQQPPQHLPYLRFCFAKQQQTLQGAIEILQQC